MTIVLAESSTTANKYHNNKSSKFQGITPQLVALQKNPGSWFSPLVALMIERGSPGHGR